MASASRFTSRYSLGAEAVLAGLVVFCPLALGGAPDVGALAPGGVGGGGVRAGGDWGPAPGPLAARCRWLAVPLLAGAALCLVQLLPLPSGLLGGVSPEAAALREFALVPLGLTSARPVSLDPPATWRELARYVAYALAFVAAVEVCRSRRSRRRLLATLAFTGAGVALLGLLHELLGLTLLFGVRAFAYARPPLVTPFGNPEPPGGLPRAGLHGGAGAGAQRRAAGAGCSSRRRRCCPGRGCSCRCLARGSSSSCWARWLLAGWALRERQGSRRAGARATAVGPGSRRAARARRDAGGGRATWRGRSWWRRPPARTAWRSCARAARWTCGR